MTTDALAGPIVGRDAELAELDAMLGVLMGGVPACLAVEGEPGIGKTSLLAELRHRAEQRGCLALNGVAAEFERELPFSIYFVACEALANVGKYAQATAASISLSPTDRGVAIEIADDGVGGADATGSSGLRGLADRVEALGGHLLVTSPAGAGTVVVADLPWRSSALTG